MLTRRASLGLAAGMIAAPPLAAPSLAKTPPIDLTDLNQMFTAYGRMRGVTPKKIGNWWYSGMILAERKGEVEVPFLKVEGFSFNRIVPHGDGTLTQVLAEAGYFMDVNTGAILSEWVNPLNKQTCKAQHYKLVQTNQATATTVSLTDTNMQPVATRGQIGPALVFGNDIWISENFSNKYVIPQRDNMDPAMYPGPEVVGTSLATFSANVSDILNPSLEFVPTLLHYQSISGFMPWMRMGREPGLIHWQLVGRKVKSIAEMPPALRARFDKDYPGWVENPGI